MSDFDQFQNLQAKPFPVILLLDVSASMGNDGKISILNRAVKDMIYEFGKIKSVLVQINVAIITFGGDAEIHTDLKPAELVEWQDMSPHGGTPLGKALRIAKGIIDDKTKISSRSYRPVTIIVSDGMPTDEWEQPMKDFISDGRSSKSQRMAMAIGAQGHKKVLELFSGLQNLYCASDAEQIAEFFNYVTMSTVEIANSSDPNASPVTDVTLQERIDNGGGMPVIDEEDEDVDW